MNAAVVKAQAVLATASNPLTTQDILGGLVWEFRSVPEVLLAVVSNPSCPSDVLMMLSTHHDAQVREAAQERHAPVRHYTPAGVCPLPAPVEVDGLTFTPTAHLVVAVR